MFYFANFKFIFSTHFVYKLHIIYGLRSEFLQLFPSVLLIIYKNAVET